jgi:vacuolar protein sorting-associated protein 16
MLFFRQFEVYQMHWDLNFENICCAAAQYGGPIAVIRDRKKFIRVQGASKPTILIYSAAGQIISSILVCSSTSHSYYLLILSLQWNSGNIIELGWSSSEELLCVQSDGIVLRYDLFGNYKHTFGMGDVLIN